MGNPAEQIKYAATRVVEGIVTLTAIIVMLALAVVLAYVIAASCTGQFEQRSDLKDLPSLLRDAPYSPIRTDPL